MKRADEPVIETYNRVPFTRITFLPDYARFGLTGLDQDTYQIICKRAYDAAACTGKDVMIYLNGQKLNIREFESYVSLYIGNKVVAKRVYAQPHERWEIAACLASNHKFQQVSFVNGICTSRGGKHVTHVSDAICKKLAEYANGQSRKKVQLKPAAIKENLWVFVKTSIVNPSFDTQTKEFLTTIVPKFGSRCDISPDFIEKLAKNTKILEYSRAMTEFKEKVDASRATGGRLGSITDPKSKDAEYARERAKATKCCLLITEGDSAATFAYAGLKAMTSEQRKYFGVFPLKGKPMNVRDAGLKPMMNNVEIRRLMKMVNLQYGVDYSQADSTRDLRYGSLWILADADTDGDHIKGLAMNIIECNWAPLLHKPGFVKSLYTPRVKVWKERHAGRKTLRDQLRCFYGDHEYAQWKLAHAGEKWEIKYYKGLGSYTRDEAREVFTNLQTVDYVWDQDKLVSVTGSERNISEYFFDLCFNKKLSDERKRWLEGYNPDLIPDYSRRQESFGQFFKEKFIQFSMEDNIRSIPHLIDGMKPSSRKVIYACLLRNFKKDVKVNQMAGAIQEKTAYHHGEASMYGTIIGLAQDFPGSGNLNLLIPSGEFGSRIRNGKDHASARYIFTRLAPLTRLIFRVEDDPLLTHLNDDGFKIEPRNYYPIFPLVLTTREIGIGTGWSSYIPSYNPQDIYDNLLHLLNYEPMQEMIPWIRGFNGYIQKSTRKGEYLARGCYRVLNTSQVEITELP